MREFAVDNRRRLLLALGGLGALALAAVLLALPSSQLTQALAQDSDVPEFEVDPFWPNDLPEDWRIGQVAGIDHGPDGNIWIVQRPGSMTSADLVGTSPAPPVMAFTPDGELVHAWGPEAAEEPEEPEPLPGRRVGPPDGPGERQGPPTAEAEPTQPRDWHGCDWPVNEHGLWVDHENNIWIGGNGSNDHVVLKMPADGSDCLLQIGEWGNPGDNFSEDLLNNPADGDTREESNEVFIADGYGSERIAVFDMDTGEYQRQFMNPDYPDDNWANPVHCGVLSDDDKLYVCDRPNSRVDVFDAETEEHLERAIVAEDLPIGSLSLMDVDFSADQMQAWLHTADGENQHVHTLDRFDLDADRQDTFGRGGRYAGQFQWIHNLATDDEGNIYTAEVSEGKRVQKFDLVE